jgi:hypothetical protein
MIEVDQVLSAPVIRPPTVYLGGKFAVLMSYGLTVNILSEILPLGVVAASQ